MRTIWIIGGPGCGKGTQCDRIREKYGFLHISSGDLLRDEVASGTSRGSSFKELIAKGLLVSTEIVLEIIKERMNKALDKGETRMGFLIDGYPRKLEQGILFEKNICTADMILYLDVCNETSRKRLLGRAEISPRIDDNTETIEKRIEIFNSENSEILEHYKDKIYKIDAEGSVNDIFYKISTIIDGLLARNSNN